MKGSHLDCFRLLQIREQWVDMGVFAPILAYKYKINVGVVSPDNQSLTMFENGLLCAGKKGWMHTLALDLINSNPCTKSTFMVLYENNHYYWLKMKTAD